MRRLIVIAAVFGVLGLALTAGLRAVKAQGTKPALKSSLRPETVQLKTVPVNFDKEYGATIARFGKGEYGEGRLHQMDAVLVELPPGGKLAAHKHLYEEMILIISGQGATTMWLPGSTNKKMYNWKESDVLSPSLNAWHETVNTSSTQPARFLVMSSAPLLTRMFGNSALALSSDYVFKDRWEKGLKEPRQLERPGRNGGKVDYSLMSIGHFIPNMLTMKMPIAFGDPDYPEEGINVVPPTDTSKGVDAEAGMAGNRLFEWQNREYLKADAGTHAEGNHHHAWEVVYYNPVGQMEIYLKLQGKDEKRRTVKWNGGDMIIVEADEVHELFTPEKGTRFLQFKVSGYFRGSGIMGNGMAGGGG